ncbi:YbdD/YjiX family protein [Sphingomonas sp. M1-B02]|nr:YbdD/YjiX family protein [Sphingomonas sp. S6-11]UZK67983.1 YbdD/YjiX family protein [Sphingomonas sp. S6-11]
MLTMMRDTARLMVGVPSYQAYRRHMADRHPDRIPISERTFFEERQQARYGGRGGGRCC